MVGTADETEFYQHVLCEAVPELNRQVPVSALGLPSSMEDKVIGNDTYAYKGTVAVKPQGTDKATFDSTNETATNYMVSIPYGSADTYVYAYQFEKVAKSSYVVVLPAVVEMTPEDGELKADLPVEITYTIPSSRNTKFSVSIPSTFEMKNTLNEVLSVSSDKQVLEWTKDTSGTTSNSDGSLTGNGSFGLSSDVEIGDWEGQVVVTISVEEQ